METHPSSIFIGIWKLSTIQEKTTWSIKRNSIPSNPHYCGGCQQQDLPTYWIRSVWPDSIIKLQEKELTDIHDVKNKATPLGRPRSVDKNNAKHRFLKFWVKMANWPWRSRSMTPIFNTSWENPKMYFGANLVILNQIHCKLLHGKAKYPRILSQNGQNDLQRYGQWPQFSIPTKSTPGYMFGANLVITAIVLN